MQENGLCDVIFSFRQVVDRLGFQAQDIGEVYCVGKYVPQYLAITGDCSQMQARIVTHHYIAIFEYLSKGRQRLGYFLLSSASDEGLPPAARPSSVPSLT
jgi:hypothetical protein